MGKPLASELVMRQYSLVLAKVTSGQLDVRMQRLITRVMKHRHIFRDGTNVDKKGDADRKKYFVDLIAECKEEREKRASHTTITKSRKKTAASTVKKKIDLVGRRVIMSADEFGGSVNECYHGLVICKGKYRQGGKTYNGFKVRWHDGDTNYWCVYAHTLTRTNITLNLHKHFTFTQQVIQRAYRLCG